MLERLEQINNKYEEINAKLATPEVIQDIKRATELSKEARNLEDIVKAYKEYKTIIDGIKDAKEMSNDPELGEFAKEEVSNLENQKEELEKKIQILLIPKDPNDDKNVIIEIRGAAGGDERCGRRQHDGAADGRHSLCGCTGLRTPLPGLP